MASPPMPDRWMWIAVGITACIAAKAIHYAMTKVVELTAIEPPSPKKEQGPATEQETAVALAKKKQKRENDPGDSISLRHLRNLTDHPNTRIRTTARTVIVQKFERTPGALKNLHYEAAHHDPERHLPAKLALRFIEEWGDQITNFQMPTYPPEVPEPIIDPMDLQEMAAELLRRRPPGAEGEEEDNARLNSLAEELGLEGQEQPDFMRLLRRVRIVDAPTSVWNTSILEEESGRGHIENARNLGSENFAGLRRGVNRRGAMVIIEDEGEGRSEGVATRAAIPRRNVPRQNFPRPSFPRRND